MSVAPDVGSVASGLLVAALVWSATVPWSLDRPLVGRQARRTGRASWRSAGAAGAPGASVGDSLGRPGAPLGRPSERGPAGFGAGRGAEPSVDLTVVLDLLGAALGSGAGVPRALEAVGRSVGGADGAGLVRAAAALLLGAGWSQAWDRVPARLWPVADALRPAWVHGAPPADALRVAGDQLVQEGRARSRTAAARLGVRLVLPLGLCLLPAFVLLGLVPVIVALGSGLGAGLLGG